ncbi:hypothetical protein B0J18DRAFT_151303 [Chaetomium sp. MPI-SDFR-AT-0129]|nr:hypothetical protein B0J18DRAFT_151303 [Chaetomium sp. MPI-SDFR-AT-0129]
MAPPTLPQSLPPLVRHTASHTDGPDQDLADVPTSTYQMERSTSLPPTVRADLARVKLANRDGGHSSPRARWSLELLCGEEQLPQPGDRPYNHNNTDEFTVSSKREHSVTSSPAGSDTYSDDDGYYSPRLAYPRPPPPQPLGAPRFLPPPWHPSAPSGPVQRRPPLPNLRDLDSAYSDSESEDMDDDEATRSLHGAGWPRTERLEMADAKQRCIRQLRYQITNKRRDLRQLRHQMDSIDNSFMQILRPHLASKTGVAMIPIDVLEGKLNEMQASRDAYYTAEVAFEAMESELEAEESRLRIIETRAPRFTPGGFDTAKPPKIPPPPPIGTIPRVPPAPYTRGWDSEASDAESAAASSTPEALLGISGSLHEDVHFLYDDLVQAASDHRLALEQVQDIEMRRDKLLYDLEIEILRKRGREGQGNQMSEEELLSLRSLLAKVPTDTTEFEHQFGIAVTTDELEFLHGYDSAHELAQNELDISSETLSRLRALCIKRGVMRKHPSLREELDIFSGCSDWALHPEDGNMSIELPPNPSASLAHPRFPILLSNPSHVLAQLTPLQALEQALKLPKADPVSALRRAECMKELGIGTLMTKFDSKPDFINQWLIHRLRTSAVEAELMLAVCEGEFRVVNLRRWQEEVLYYWRHDEAATQGFERFDTPITPRDDTPFLLPLLPSPNNRKPIVTPAGVGTVARMPLEVGRNDENEGGSVWGEANSAIIGGEGKARSDSGGFTGSLRARERWTRSVKSSG